MKAFVVKNPIGIFVFDENEELVYHKLFSHNAEKALEEFLKKEEVKVEGYEIETDGAAKILRKKFRGLARSLHFVEGDEELNEFLNEFMIIYSKKKIGVKETSDKVLIQSSNALEEINKTISLYKQRLGEWDSFKKADKKDAEIIKSYSDLIDRLEKQKKELEDYVKKSTKNLMPNFSSLINPLLASKLLALAGSLEKLSKLTASSIQLLGAEKALFRHLRRQGKSPKFGTIYFDPRIQHAPDNKQGKVARTIAAYLMKAARIDYYSDRMEKKLKEELEKELKAIR